MKNDLIERYVYAVTKKMPTKLRNDVSEELNSLIFDMLEERCGATSPSETDVRLSLTELGSPSELAEKYDIDSKKCLIGTPYYSTYKFVLKIVLICTAFGMALAGLLTQITQTLTSDIDTSQTASDVVTHIVDTSPMWFTAAIQWLAAICSGLVYAFGFVTALFAFFYHKEIKLTVSANLDDLPPVPKTKELIPKWEPIFGISFIMIFFIVFLLAPQTIFVLLTAGSVFIPVFNEEMIKTTWYIIVLFGMLGVIRETIKLIDGRYTKRVMLTSIVVDILSAILAFWWLFNGKIINPVFVLSISDVFKGSSEFVINIFANFQYVLLGMILFALVLDAITTIVHTMKSRAV